MGRAVLHKMVGRISVGRMWRVWNGGEFELLQGSAELNGDKCLDDECDQDSWVSSDDWGKQDVTCARRCSPGLL